MTFLDRIAQIRSRRVEEARGRVPLDELRERCRRAGPARDALARLSAWPSAQRAIIAEIKRRSPSKGPLRPDLRPRELAGVYEKAGAFAISVLTEEDHFGGSPADLVEARGAVEIPILWKDFVLDGYQLWEARACGADLALLIVALLGERTGEFVDLARQTGLEPLVEVHGASELDTALSSGARLVGINNRDLKTFRVDLSVTRELLPKIPADVRVVSESGLRSVDDLEDLGRAGASAFLIGEALVTSGDPGAELTRLVGR